MKRPLIERSYQEMRIAGLPILETVMLGALAFLLSTGRVEAETRYWGAGSVAPGTGGDYNWSTATHWTGDTVPGAADAAVLCNTNVANCTVDALVNVASFLMDSNYSGTVTCGANDFAIGNNAAGGDFTIRAGTFVAPSGNLKPYGNFNHTVGGTFTHNNGTVVLGCTANAGMGIDVMTSETFNNLTINHVNLWAAAPRSIAAGDTLIVLGTLDLTKGQLKGGTIDARGPVTFRSTFGTRTGTSLDPGYTLINLNPSSPQSYTINAGGGFPGLLLASPNIQGVSFSGNAATMIGGTGDINNHGSFTMTNNIGITVDASAITNLWFGHFNLYAGTFIAPTGTMSVGGHFVWTNGTFNANGGTAVMGRTANLTPSLTVPGTGTFYNLVIDQALAASGLGAALTRAIPAGKTVVVLKDLTVKTGKLNGGTVEARGNVSVSTNWRGGNAAYFITGTATQTISGASSNITTGTFTITNTAGIARLGSSVTISNLVVSKGGTLDLAGNSLANAAFSLSGTLMLHGDETLATDPVVGAGSTVQYTGGASPVTVRNWAYRKLTINAPDKQLNWTAGVTTTVSEAFTVQGTQPHHFVTLRSTAPGTQWYINTTGASTDVSRVDVQDSVSTLPIKASLSQDSGRNVNWFFTNTGTVLIIR
jgi:hypothetical protein